MIFMTKMMIVTSSLLRIKAAPLPVSKRNSSFLFLSIFAVIILMLIMLMMLMMLMFMLADDADNNDVQAGRDLFLIGISQEEAR